MSDITIRRSQAISQHEAYVVLPSAHASSAVLQQVLQQIQMLHESERASLQSQLSKYTHPATACGSDGSASISGFKVDGGDFNASITFYKSSDCTTAFFNNSQLNNTSQMYDDAIWPRDQYAGYYYNVPGCPDVKPVGHYSHLVSQSAHVGYYYENVLYPDATCQGGNNDDIWDNIGPIN